jgi:hypothetical protein
MYIDVLRPSRTIKSRVNPLNAELNPICYLLALLAHHFLHVSRIRVKQRQHSKYFVCDDADKLVQRK